MFHQDVMCCTLVSLCSSSEGATVGAIKKGVLKKKNRKAPVLECFCNKVAGLRSATLWKTDSSAGVFLWILRNFKKHLFYKPTPVLNLRCFLQLSNFWHVLVSYTRSQCENEVSYPQFRILWYLQSERKSNWNGD